MTTNSKSNSLDPAYYDKHIYKESVTQSYGYNEKSTEPKYALPMLCKDFRDLERWRTDIRIKAAQKDESQKIITVEIPTFHPTGLVPPKKDDGANLANLLSTSADATVC